MKLNNNRFKSELIKFIGENGIPLISYCELSLQNLNSADFEIVIKSNRCALHTIRLSYHLHIRNIKTDINKSNLTTHTFDNVQRVIGFCNKKRREIGYSE